MAAQKFSPFYLHEFSVKRFKSLNEDLLGKISLIFCKKKTNKLKLKFTLKFKFYKNLVNLSLRLKYL